MTRVHAAVSAPIFLPTGVLTEAVNPVVGFGPHTSQDVVLYHA
jgi:hypothetical protein